MNRANDNVATPRYRLQVCRLQVYDAVFRKREGIIAGSYHVIDIIYLIDD